MTTLKPILAVLAQGKCQWKLDLQGQLFSTTEPRPAVFYWDIQDSPVTLTELLRLRNNEPVVDKCLLHVGG